MRTHLKPILAALAAIVAIAFAAVTLTPSEAAGPEVETVAAVRVERSTTTTEAPPAPVETTTTTELPPVTEPPTTTTEPPPTTVAPPPTTLAPPPPPVTEPPPPVTEPPAEPPPAPSGSVEQVIYGAAAEFGVDGNLMLRIARCESGLNPSAVNSSSGALGLFQHMPQYWGGRASALGYGYDAWSDPTANARVSAVLMRDGGPGHWRACL